MKTRKRGERYILSPLCDIILLALLRRLQEEDHQGHDALSGAYPLR